jgi:hypothetical protein
MQQVVLILQNSIIYALKFCFIFCLTSLILIVLRCPQVVAATNQSWLITLLGSKLLVLYINLSCQNCSCSTPPFSWREWGKLWARDWALMLPNTRQEQYPLKPWWWVMSCSVCLDAAGQKKLPHFHIFWHFLTATHAISLAYSATAG